jgi:hypothetical protein
VSSVKRPQLALNGHALRKAALAEMIIGFWRRATLNRQAP